MQDKSIHLYIKGVSQLVDITAGGDFLSLCDQKSSYNMCLILDGYGTSWRVMYSAWWFNVLHPEVFNTYL